MFAKIPLTQKIQSQIITEQQTKSENIYQLESENTQIEGDGVINNINNSHSVDSYSVMSNDRTRRVQYHRMLTKGNLDEVKRQVSIDIQADNQDAISIYTRAKLAEKQKNYEQAISDFEKVLKLDPSFYNAAYGKATCENIIGRYNEAIETYNLAFSKDSDSPTVHIPSLNRSKSLGRTPLSPIRNYMRISRQNTSQ